MVQHLVDNRLEGGKLAHEFGIHGVQLLLDLGLKFDNAEIGGTNLISYVLKGLLGMSDGSLQVLVVSVGHLDEGFL
jgi:hypothetical protein